MHNKYSPFMLKIPMHTHLKFFLGVEFRMEYYINGWRACIVESGKV